MDKAPGSLLSESRFYQLWRTEFPYVKCSRPKGTHSMCNVCSKLTGLIKKAPNEVERLKLIVKRRQHWDLQRKQRIKYYQVCVCVSVCVCVCITVLVCILEVLYVCVSLKPSHAAHSQIQTYIIHRSFEGAVLCSAHPLTCPHTHTPKVALSAIPLL